MDGRWTIVYRPSSGLGPFVENHGGQSSDERLTDVFWGEMPDVPGRDEVARTRVLQALAGVLVVVGFLLVAGGAGVMAKSAWEERREKARLRQRLAAVESVSVALLTSTPFPTPTPTATAAPPTWPGGGGAVRPADRDEQAPRPVEARKALTPAPTPTPTPTPEPPAPPVRIRIPALGVDTRVVPVPKMPVNGSGLFTWATADYAAGYHEGSAYPGQRGNLIISGHNNIKGAVFRPLSLLGDPDVPFPYGIPVYITDARGRVFVYRFAAIYKLREAGASLAERLQNARFLAPTDVPVLTLITCWPVNGNAYRIVVRAWFAGLAGEVSPPDTLE